jgi:outer membrane autotransporter protein
MHRRRALIPAVLFLGIVGGGAAAAADFGAAPLLSPTPVYNWNGFYVGGHLGFAAESSTVTETPLDTAIATSGSATSNSIMGGAQIGFNWVIVPHIVIGFEWDVSGASFTASPATAFGGGGAVGWSDSIDWFGTARGRLGYAFDNWMVYGTGGFAWAREALTRTQLTAGPTSPPAGATFSLSDIKTGWSAGAGVEWGFAPNWNARLEYLYISLAQDTTPYTAPSPIAARTFNVSESFTLQTVRLGVNYRFDWGANLTTGDARY